jgi:hypothetical protein
MLSHLSLGVRDLDRPIPRGRHRQRRAGRRRSRATAHYGKTYYAAFVFDPDGHKLEAKHA